MRRNASSSTMELVLGTAQLRNDYGVTTSLVGSRHRGDAIELLRAAVHEGVEALDTAPAYGEAEATIGEVAWTGSLHTKIDPELEPATSLVGSLDRLRRSGVDVLYLHDASEVLRPDSPVIAAAQSLVGHGIGALGASIYEIGEFDAAMADPRIGVIQAPLNVLDRRIDESRLARAQSAGVAVYARSVLLQGVLTASPDAVEAAVAGLGGYVSAFQAVARRWRRSPLEAALGWVRAVRGIKGLVIGAESPEELHGVARAARSEPLDDAMLSELRSLDQPERRLVDPRTWSKGV